MRLLIAHPSSIRGHRLRTAMTGHANIDVVQAVRDLSAAYDFAEHHKPDCLLVAAQLANCPEFELLSSLLNILGIGCVIIDADNPPESELLFKGASQYVTRLTSAESEDEILTALRGAKRSRPTNKGPAQLPKRKFDPRRIVMIGSSTGGIDALLKIIGGFPEDCPPTMIIQHTGGAFTESLIRLLNGRTAARVQEARNGHALEPGHIYVAPGDQAHLHLQAGTSRRMALVSGPPVSGHCPSADAMFSSATNDARHITAAILTGMGRDGAAGITALRAAGATTFGQDKATSVVYGMPRVAYEMGGIETQLAIDDIGPAILRTCQISECR